MAAAAAKGAGGGASGGVPGAAPAISGLFCRPAPLDAIIDTLPSGLIILDRDRNVLRINRRLEGMIGFSVAEGHGGCLPCRHLLRGRLCVTGCPARSMNADSPPVTVESDLIDRERRRIPVRVTLAPVRAMDGGLIGFTEVIEDLRVAGAAEGRRPAGDALSGIIGNSPQMQKIFNLLPAVAQSDSSVLITGETGAGKDLIAEAIHRASERAGGPFVKVNCGALPETLLESELFGHQKGAFTGATDSKPGRFRLAHNGTLYLTEIGDLPLPLQVKLLTFLDDQVVYPLGGTRGFQTDVRVVAGTHRDLERMVREGLFRQDLLFRLNVVRLRLPALREREGDARLLLDHFLATLSQRFGKPMEGFSRAALSILLSYPYPGNVREIRNIVEYAINVSRDRRIDIADLPAYLTEPETPPAPTGEAGAGPSPAAWAGPEDTWADTERRMILDALVKAGGRRGKAADILGWGRSTLWRRMKRLGIDGG